MADNRLKKIEETRRCFAVIKKLRLHMMKLNSLSLTSSEGCHMQSILMHMDNVQSSLNSMYSMMQDQSQSGERKQGNSRSIKQ